MLMVPKRVRSRRTVVRVQRTEPHVDAESQENGWAGPSARE